MNCYEYDNQPDPGDDPMIDPSDMFDTDREWPVANSDWTKHVPPIPGTFDPREDWPDEGPGPEDRPPF